MTGDQAATTLATPADLCPVDPADLCPVDPDDLVAVADRRLAQVEELADPAARDAALDLVRALLELYGEALARVTAAAVGAGGDPVRDRLAADPLTSHLLLLHGCHPLDLPARVARAVAAVRPRLGAREPDVVRADTQEVRLRLAGGGCASSSAAARTALAEAVRAAAPEVDRVEIDEPPPPPVLIPLADVRAAA